MLLILRQKWVAVNSLVFHRVSLSTACLPLKEIYAVTRQIIPRILKWTIRRGQSKFSTVIIFVSCEEKGYYLVVSVGQLSFDSNS